MNIVEHIVDMNEVTESGEFISDPLQVGNDGKAMFTAYPSDHTVGYGLIMQGNIAATGPDGPFQDQWGNLPDPPAAENVNWPTSGIYINLLPGVFVRVHIFSIKFNSPLGSLRLALRTEALSGSQ